MRRRGRGAVARVRATGGRLGDRARTLGLLPHRPERWSVDRWGTAYRSGQLDYYGRLDELARYSLLVGYVGWWVAQPGARPPRLLDVGCGTGLLRERLAGLPLEEYLGVDLSAPAIEEATGRAFPRSRFVVGDLMTIPLDGPPHDIAVVNEVLYYAPDPGAFLDRVAGLLAPDGLLLVSMWRHPGDGQLWRRVDERFTLLDRVEVRDRANPVNPRGWQVACHRRRG